MAEHHRAMRGIAHEVDEQCGGLRHLELAENEVGGEDGVQESWKGERLGKDGTRYGVGWGGGER